MDIKADALHSSAVEAYELVNNVFRIASGLKGSSPTISRSLDEIAFRHYAQQPPVDNFRILLDVELLEPHEIEIHVLKNEVVEIRGRHDKRHNRDGLWLSGSFVDRYYLPSEVMGKELHAQWSVDNYLCIKSTSTSCEENCDRMRLVPQLVPKFLKPKRNERTMADMPEEKRNGITNMLKDIKDKSGLALSRVINFLHIPPLAPCDIPEPNLPTEAARMSREDSSASAICESTEETNISREDSKSAIGESAEETNMSSEDSSTSAVYDTTEGANMSKEDSSTSAIGESLQLTRASSFATEEGNLSEEDSSSAIGESLQETRASSIDTEG